LISEPLAELFHALVPSVLAVSDSAMVKPSKCVSTMYSDRRFSQAAPLKEYMYIRFRELAHEKDILGLYFDMGSEDYSYGIRIYKQTSVGMVGIRDGITTEQAAFARALGKAEKLQMTIIGDSFAKDHYPEESGHIKELLNKRNFHIGRTRPIGEAVFDGTLLDEIAGAYAELKELYALLRKALYQ